MKVLLETTEWEDTTPNHVYFMDDTKEKMYAFVIKGSLDVFQFKQPIRINTRNRSFITAPNIWNYVVPDQAVNTRI